jgi:hypothetical protein
MQERAITERAVVIFYIEDTSPVLYNLEMGRAESRIVCIIVVYREVQTPKLKFSLILLLRQCAELSTTSPPDLLLVSDEFFLNLSGNFSKE